jgi:probable phosphoglycerate mutase
VELIFLRHGEPAWAVEGLSQPDPYLTERGHAQAQLAARRLADATTPPNEILVSPAVRAQQTAAPLVAGTGLAATTVDGLLEIQMPRVEDMLEAEVVRMFTAARHRPPEEWWDGLPGGESFREFHQRVASTLQGLLEARGMRPDTGRAHMWHVADPSQRIVIVAHGGTNAVALGWLLDVDPTPWEWERFVLGHCSIARVRAIELAGGHVFSLRAFNDREHLPADLRTR